MRPCCRSASRNYFDEVAAATRGNAEHHDHREGLQAAVRKAIVNRPAARWLLSRRPDFAAAVAAQLADAAMPARMIHKDKFWACEPPPPATTSSPPDR